MIIQDNLYKIIKTNTLDITKVNNTNDCGGRFGNIFIRNFVAEYIAKKNNLKIIYERYEQLEKLGIKLFIGENTYEETLVITDNNIDSIIFNEDIFNKYALNKNIIFRQVSYNPLNLTNYAWCQTSLIANMINNTLNIENRIYNNNPYQKRYGNNNDLFIHIRLGDIVDLKFNSPYEYYDNIISRIYDSDNYKNSIYFNTGISYITSDSINHNICQRLIKKYKLKVYESDEIDTLQFGSTCQSIILSNGTYSWLLGILSIHSNIHYPNITKIWHGNIFVFPNWHKIGW